MDRAALRAEVERSALAEVERVGPDAFRPSTIALLYADKGADRATIYRWLAELKKSGRMGAHVAARVREAVAERAARAPDPAADAAREVAAVMPRPLGPDDITAAGGIGDFVATLTTCMQTAQKILAQATAPDGTIRQPRLAIVASEHLRRCLETAARVAATMRDVNNLARFHGEVIAAVQAEAPEVAERLAQRLVMITQRFAPETD